jgi:hypothetical protein
LRKTKSSDYRVANSSQSLPDTKSAKGFRTIRHRQS